MYENGYLPKVAFHLAAENAQKANYFLQRQNDVYGEVTVEQLLWCHREALKLQKLWRDELAEFNAHLGRY